MMGTTDFSQFSHTVWQVMYFGHSITIFDHHALKLCLCARRSKNYRWNFMPKRERFSGGKLSAKIA